MNLYISNITLLSSIEIAVGLATQLWPSYKTLLVRAQDLGYDGLEVSMLSNWKPNDVTHESKNNICAFEAPWYEQGFMPDFLSHRLFGAWGYEKLKKVLKKRQIYNYPYIPTVDCYDDPHTLMEIAGKADQKDLAMAILSDINVGTTCICYDTWHTRELVSTSSRDAWMPGVLHSFLFECNGIKKLYDNHGFIADALPRGREVISARQFEIDMLHQFKLFAPRARLFQVQTRSRRELGLFVQGKSNLLSDQVNWIGEHLKKSEHNIPVSVELPPWFSNRSIKLFGQRVREKIA